PMTAEDRIVRQVMLDKFAAALTDFYAGNFSAAREQFADLQGADAVAGAYCRKCEALLRNPPKAWEGVWEMTEK
ncbi:MAG: adenylate/guanylate cyclase domain-containing protein, partial [Lentisphaerae bacterium]|nr:adenylate/guanylate cyclase domain-containing protein [Lentisphaerota bacterium]